MPDTAVVPTDPTTGTAVAADAAADAATGDERVVVTACPLDCPDTCSLEVTVRLGRVVAVDAVPADRAVNPLTQGFICAKVKRYGQRVHSPLRITTPLVRTGPKGSGSFRAVSWDEAIGLVAERLRVAAAGPGGPAAVVPYLYNSSAGLLAKGAGLSLRLWDWFGAAWVEHTICAATYGEAWDAVYPGLASVDPLDVPASRFLVFWGANPTASNTHLLPLVGEARAAGAKVVVVDPRRTGVAQRADWHLPVRPGTDAVLALAMARHAARHGLVDTGFVERHVDGAEAFLASAEPWTLDRAADVCGVDAAVVAEVVEAWAATRPALLRVGYGMERNRNGGQALRAALALPALLGTFGERGSGVLGSLSPGRPVHVGRVAPPWADHRAPRRWVNQNLLGALLTGEELGGGPPVEVLFVQGANPVAMNPAQTKVLAGMEREDLFTVVHDQVMTDTALMADVVLPATTHLEALDVAVSYGSATLQEMPPVIDRVGESRTNDEVAAALAAALGYPAAPFDPEPGALLDAVITGSRTQVFERPQVPFVDTFPRDGRVRLHPVPEALLPADPADPDGSLPYALITPASSRTVNSMLADVRPPEPAVSMHPDDAAREGLADGARVRLENARGAVDLVVRCDGSVRPGVLSVPKGLWRSHVGGGLTVNALCPDTLEPTAGGACFNDARVRIMSVP